MQLKAYLTYNGNTEEAMNFIKDALGGTIESLMRFGDAPGDYSEADKNKVMHAVMQVADTTLFFSDGNEQNKVNFGNNISLSLNFNSDDEITKAFNALSAGGQVTMPLQDTFWGAKFGMCIDKFGVNWLFNWDKPKS